MIEGQFDDPAPRKAGLIVGSDSVLARLATGRLGLILLAGIVLVVTGAFSDRAPALADEYVYLAGSRHFSDTWRLDAKYYLSYDLLDQGFPHQDVHAPGYIILLGLFMKLTAPILPPGYPGAVAFNSVCFVLCAELMRQIALALGRCQRDAWVTAVVFMVFPVTQVFVYWAMPEVALLTVFVAALFCLVRYGDSLPGAAAGGLLLGLAFLVRESALFGLPAALALLLGKRRSLVAFCLAGLAFGFLVYLPLSADRAQGGANLWTSSRHIGGVFEYHAVLAARSGQLGETMHLVSERAQRNWGELLATTGAERAILLTYMLIPFWTLLHWRRNEARARRLLAGLLIGLLTFVCVLFGFYVIGQWSGYRYLMLMVPPLLVFVQPPSPAGAPRFQHLGVLALLGACLFIEKGVLDVFGPFKATRHRGDATLAYVESYLPGTPDRIVWRRGYEYGLRHYPVEVIVSLPQHLSELKAIEQAVWFDYLILPRDSDWGERPRYQQLNAPDPSPPVKIYRRLR